ncbi:hypothetical protein [Dyella sedimenti]|uniref:hypothetical protein n=1 Tax=Dyella sedimenti TaxID=2919947 RepID=UPI001FA94DD8|nr:hypothetical protein [Dyella sedimenti]
MKPLPAGVACAEVGGMSSPDARFVAMPAASAANGRARSLNNRNANNRTRIGWAGV